MTFSKLFIFNIIAQFRAIRIAEKYDKHIGTDWSNTTFYKNRLITVISKINNELASTPTRADSASFNNYIHQRIMYLINQPSLPITFNEELLDNFIDPSKNIILKYLSLFDDDFHIQCDDLDLVKTGWNPTINKIHFKADHEFHNKFIVSAHTFVEFRIIFSHMNSSC